MHEFRPGLEFDVIALERYLDRHLEGFSGSLIVRQFAGGQSNPTYQLCDSSGRPCWVLRRKPPGVLLPSAHAIEREFKVLQALASHTRLPVAQVCLLCEDSAVIGTPFFVMDFVDGRIFWDPTLPEVGVTERRTMFESMVSVLADLHEVDYRKIGLQDYGRPEQYVARQITRWSKQYASDSQTAGRVEIMERLIEWLPRHIPADEPAATLVHGDYRIDNMMFDRDSSRVIAVLDWELSTLGNPIADFAYHLMMYRLRSAVIPGLAGADLESLGLPEEKEYVRWYCSRRKMSEIPHLDFYLAFCMFRLAGIFHGIRGRVSRGTAASAVARRYADEVESMAALAWAQAIEAEKTI
jgi:aminoglycoside phosphotransferase (APT) family kinase protein